MGGRWDADRGNLSPSAQNLAVWVFEQWMARLPNSQLSGSRDADDLARRTRRQLS
jgi:hypothetical protein